MTTQKMTAAQKRADQYAKMIGHEERALALALFVFDKTESLATAVAKEATLSGLKHYTKADAEKLKTHLMEQKGLKADAARKAISRVRAALERAGLKVERDKRGGSRAPQAPTGPDNSESDGVRDDKATADELEKSRKKKAKAAEQHVNATLDYVALMPSTWATKSEETTLVTLLKRLRKNAQADSE